MAVESLRRIPSELRSYPAWVMWRYENRASMKPTKVPYSARTGTLANVADGDTWTTFDAAMHVMASNRWYDGIGFVLSAADPFAFIDLDDTKGDANATARQFEIYNHFESYAERSPSGKGLHIIVKGAVPTGRRRGSIEVYSSTRYMTMTGDVYRDAPIRDYDHALNALHASMGPSNVAATVYAGLAEQTETDEQVIEHARQAANGKKFADLFAGDWQKYYDSQSEGDFALTNIIAFYSHNRAQITRIFRLSGLGQREKAKRANYVNYMLDKAFDRLLPPIDIEGLTNQFHALVPKLRSVDNV